MAVYSRILLALDFTAATDTVVKRALDLRQAFSAQLSLVHVVEFMQVDLYNDLVMPQEFEIDRDMMQHATQRLQELAEKPGYRKSGMFCPNGQYPTRDSKPGRRTEHRSDRDRQPREGGNPAVARLNG